MAKNILVIIMLLAVGACKVPHAHNESKAPKEPFIMEFNPKGEFGFGFNHYKDGDCEYIWFVGSNTGGLTHKGDCKNPIHCYNEIVDGASN
tara:strand:+ start:222 stop:494 length:273 start_codon:yes stop_codon:yes gene_type:complete